MKYKVVEMFTSINGEGVRAGQLAVFVRFAGCNLNCAYCDTKWANQKDTPYQEMSVEEICEALQKTGVDNVTLTGGEPLLQEGMRELIASILRDAHKYVEIETNGSILLESCQQLCAQEEIGNRLTFTMDYKLGGSGMEENMELSNMKRLQKKDTVKFVCSDYRDLEKAEEIIRKYHLDERCHVYLSPVFGKIDPADMVEYMKERRLNGVNLQLQLHKFIWDPNERGV